MSQWISIEDRLPSRENQGYYLVHESDEITIKFWYGWEQDEELQKSEWSNVTHWMPLPQPPGGDTD